MSHAPIPTEPEHNPASNPASRSGPRTEAGRRRSRLNARKHGLTAALPDGEAEAALMQSFADRWTAQLGADTEAEEALIRSSAVAYARLERCRKVEEATLKDAGRKAIAAWEKKRQHAARKLAKDPSNTLADLEADAFGCEWLIRQWLRLDARLEQGIGWDREEFPRAMHLFGLLPQAPGPDADPIVQRFWYLARLCSGFPIAPTPQLPQDPISGRTALRTIIAEELDRLESLRDQLWHDHDQAEAISVAQLAQMDTSKEGQLRHRYRREAFSEMIRGINQVMRLRGERSKDQDRIWHQAHPEFNRRRLAPTGPTRAGFPNVAPPNPYPEPACSPGSASASNAPVSSRNEPEHPAPEQNPDRHNLNSSQEMRVDPLRSPSACDWRTEPCPASPSPSDSERQGTAEAPSPPPDHRR